MDSRKDAVTQAAARTWLKMNPTADWATSENAGKAIGKNIKFAGQVYLMSKATLSIGAFVGDLTLDPIVRQLIFRPSGSEVRAYIAARKPKLETYTDPLMGISFEYPAEWSASEPTKSLGTEGPDVFDANGKVMATAVFGNAFDMSPCPAENPYQMLESTPLRIPGMDTSQAPTTIRTEVVDYSSGYAVFPDRKPVRLYVQLYSNPGYPEGTTKVCNAIGIIQHSGKYGFFSADRGFDTVQEASAYLTTKEYGQVKTMLASLRFL